MRCRHSRALPDGPAVHDPHRMRNVPIKSDWRNPKSLLMVALWAPAPAARRLLGPGKAGAARGHDRPLAPCSWLSARGASGVPQGRKAWSREGASVSGVRVKLGPLSRVSTHTGCIYLIRYEPLPALSTNVRLGYHLFTPSTTGEVAISGGVVTHRCWTALTRVDSALARAPSVRGSHITPARRVPAATPSSQRERGHTLKRARPTGRVLVNRSGASCSGRHPSQGRVVPASWGGAPNTTT